MGVCASDSPGRMGGERQRALHFSISLPVGLLIALLAACLGLQGAAAERHVAAGSGHVCVIQAGGVAACYGAGTLTGKLAPPAGVAFHAVTAGDDFSCGLTAGTSQLRCWGTLPGNPSLPTDFFIDAHAGPRHVCALRPNGTVACYGDGSRGATTVPAGIVFQGVTAGTHYTCGVARNHSVVCWGDAANSVVAGRPWSSIGDADHVACGADHACFVRVNGSVACWGSNSSGQAMPPAALASNGSVWWLAAGNGMTCAMSGSVVPGAVVCWGRVTGTQATAYEAACAAWGCVVSNITGSGGTVSAVVFSAVGGTPLPQVVGAPGVSVGVVTWLAGSGAGGCNDGVGAAATFYYPTGVSAASDGTIYVTDRSGDVIRRLVPWTRAVTTLAGICGVRGGTFGATPLQSTFMWPYETDSDKAGNVYVASTENQAIRMLSGEWVAGTGGGGSADGVGGAAAFLYPGSVRFDLSSGLLYVADTDNRKVRIINTTTRSVSTLATVSARVFGLGLHPPGRFMFAGLATSIEKVTYDGVVTPVAGRTTAGFADGTGTAAAFDRVCGVVLDSTASSMLVADLNNHRIRMVTPSGVVSTFAGSGSRGVVDGTGTAASLNGPWGMTKDGLGTLYIADSLSNTIRQMTVQPPTTVSVLPAPLPQNPIAPTDQLTAWRALAAGSNSSATPMPWVDARTATFTAPLAAANTAGLNPAVTTLLLGNVTLVARDAAATPAAATAGNATFSTSAQRGLIALALSTAAVPADSLALSALTSLTLAGLASGQPPELSARSFGGLPALSCVNCGGTLGLVNLSGFALPLQSGRTSFTLLPVIGLFPSPPAAITALDLSANALSAVSEHDFDGVPNLRWLSLARNNITVVSDAAFTDARHPRLAAVDDTGNAMLGVDCPPATYVDARRLSAGGIFVCCRSCTAGSFCVGATARPTACPAGAYCPAGASGSLPCPAGSYCPPRAAAAPPCPSGFYCPAGSAAALACPVGSYCPPMSPAPPPVLGVAPTATSSQTAAAVVLLPPLLQVSALVNISVAGTALCVGTSPRLTFMTVGGVPCAAVACPDGGSTGSDGSLATCVGWNASAALAGTPTTAGAQLQLNASALWAAASPPQSLLCEACVPAFTRPTLASIVPPTIAAAGVPVALSGAGFMDASRTLPTVLIGGVACGSVVALTSTVVRCAAPALSALVPGFPVVSVEVINSAGAASTDAVTLTYPASFTATWTPASQSTPIIALPGAPLAPSPALSVLSREAATCALTINASACTNPDAATLLSRPVGMAVQTSARTPLAVAPSGSVSASTTALTLDGLVVSGASGCAGTLVASCIDTTGNTATTAGQRGPALALAGWSAVWSHTLATPLVLAPAPLPSLNASFQLVDAGGAAAAAASYLNLTAAAASFLSCLAVLAPVAAGAPAPDTPLDRLPPRNVLSSVTSTLGGVDAAATSLALTFAGLTAGAAALGQTLVLHAECTWAPTGERVRLPPIPAAVLQLRLGWVAPAASMLQGYKAHALPLTLEVVTPASGLAVPTAASCSLRLLNATVRSAALVGDAWSVVVDPASPAGTSLPTAPNATLQAPPGAVVYLEAACEVWGQSLVSPPLRLSIASLTLRAVSTLPASFIASDASSPWPLEPPLALQVVTVEGSEPAVDVTCAVTTPTPGASLVIVDATTTLTSLLSIPAHPTTGVAAVPRFVVSTSPATPAVTLAVACRRTASGDAASELTFDVPAVQLRVALCNRPQPLAAVGVALAPFSVGIDTTAGGATTSACTSVTTPNNAPALPPIACTIALNASASTTSDTANIFLQHAVATVAAASRRAEFDTFTLVAPQGESYGLTATCSVGGLAIPPTLPFSVTLRGCPPGQQSVSVTCVTCGGGAFSLGGLRAACTGCPAAGATCDAGILTLRPRFFRPPSQAGQPLGPTTELHPCYNAEACTLTSASNGSGAEYGCAPGYTGPLCGVCDAASNYARFGEACGVCWNPAASWLFLLTVVAIVGTVLTRVALRTESSRSDASIVLRITLSYLQAVGSLRVFRAGSTQAYGAVMGWTEVVSASPLSVGALQCILWLPYLVQYIATVTLPLLAAVAVVIIFLSVSAARVTRIRPRWSFDTPAFCTAVNGWWASKRHLSTLLFVLFLAYMPIISASLRALDCVSPIAGVRYLRSDLAVECGVGQHAAARALAFTVLVAAGLGFPVGLAWMLGTATQTQLLDDSFHATWGFLFDGYRAPIRTLVADAAGGGGGSDSGSHATSVPGKTTGTGTTTGAGGGPRSGHRRSSILEAVPGRLAQRWAVSGDSRVWWEGVVLARKGGVVLLAVSVTNPYLQCVGATLWFAAFAVLQGHFSPYSKPLFNRLEMASLAATFLTAVVSTALLQFNVGVASADLHAPDAMTGLEWAVTVLLVLINLGTFIALAGLWVHLQCHRARGAIVRRVSVVSALGGRVVSLAPRRTSAAPQSHEPSGVEMAAATQNPLRARAVVAATAAAGADATPGDVAPPAAVDAAGNSAALEATGRAVVGMPPLPVDSAAAAGVPAPAVGAITAAGAPTTRGGGGVDARGMKNAAASVVHMRRQRPVTGTATAP